MFFLKKSNQVETSKGGPALGAKESSSDKVVAFTLPEKSTAVAGPSSEGLAIARRLSGERTAIPAGFIVRAEHFHLSGQSSLAGRLEGELYGNGRVEIGATGSFAGTAVCDEMAVAGVFEGDGLFERISIKSGGECRGRIKGGSFSLSEGGIFDGEYSRREGDAPFDVAL